MKKIELLGLSLITAALVMTTGCSDDDDDKKASGPSAPSEISTPVELNASVARNALALVFEDGSISPAPMREPDRDGPDENSSESSTRVIDCDISGTMTITRSSVFTSTREVDWSGVITESKQYDNCMDNDDEYDTRTRNGMESTTQEKSYTEETDTNMRREYIYRDYSDFHEDNNTHRSDKTTYTAYTKEKIETYQDSIERSTTYRLEDGERKAIERDAEGTILNGEREYYGTINMTRERINDISEDVTVNGFFAMYDVNATGGEKIIEGGYYSDYRVHWYEPDTGNGSDSHEEAITVDGTIGNLCLGGSITISTAPVVHSNQYDYFDKDGNAPGSAKSSTVLPYSGQQHISGANSATVTYDFNSTKNTSATVTIGSESKVYGTWSEFLADNNCSDAI